MTKPIKYSMRVSDQQESHYKIGSSPVRTQCCNTLYIWRGSLNEIWQTKVQQDRLPTELTVLLISDTCWQLVPASPDASDKETRGLIIFQFHKYENYELGL